jgi:hypothetical protein
MMMMFVFFVALRGRRVGGATGINHERGLLLLLT